MSSSSRQGTLVVRGDPGVQIRILTPSFSVCAEGTVELSAAVEPGLYLVTWIGPGASHQEVVRVHPGRERLVEFHGALTTTAPKLGPARKSAVPKTASEDARPQVIVLVEGDTSAARGLEIRLFLRDELAMRSDRADVDGANAEVTGRIAARVYRVDAAVYRLQFLAMSGELVSQSIAALPGRRTVVLLRAGVGNVLTQSGEGASLVHSLGVDPQSTLIATIAADETLGKFSAASRLAEILLSDLASGRTSLGERLLELIEQSGDPLLKVYAATSILQRVQAQQRVVLDDTPDAAEPQVWIDRALSLMEGLDADGSPADVATIRWFAKSLAGEGMQSDMPRLRTPPLLEASWRWAAARSVDQPDTIPDSPSFRAAGRSIVSAAPWLIWRSAAAKAWEPQVMNAAKGDLDAAVEALVSASRNLTTASGPADTARYAWSPMFDPLASLSPDLRSITNSALRISSSASADYLRARSLGQRLAATVSMPATTLHARVQQALEEVRRIELPSASAIAELLAPSPPANIAPPLSLPIINPDDPQKSWFGGLAERDGFRLSARFNESAADWVGVDLTVEGPAADGESVEFYLHDTFDPDHYAEPFSAGRAEFDLKTWGGFTVGVWIPSRQMPLELDLAQSPDAPRIIREL